LTQHLGRIFNSSCWVNIDPAVGLKNNPSWVIFNPSLLRLWPNPTLEKQCVGVCVSLLGCRLRNYWHYWRLTELLFWTCWCPATQICDLEGHDVPPSLSCIIDGDMLPSICICGGRDNPQMLMLV